MLAILKDKNIDFIAVDINPKAIELAKKMQKHLKF
jgi:methylase of polypeptide subunit release factors